MTEAARHLVRIFIPRVSCLLAAIAPCGWVLLIALLVSPPSAAEAGGAEPTVIVLSFDGLRHDYLDRDPGLAALGRMAREGARAESLVPVFPSSTFPNHVSLATGAHADRHGIVANRFHDPELGEFDYGNDARFLDAEPLWAAAERQGVRAAVYFWVGSETDWRGVGATHRVAPFDGTVGEREKADQILAWLDLPEPERPRLVMSWWHGADKMGHRHGPDHENTRAQLAGQDRELLRLLEALDAREAWSHTTLLVVSDHGMAAVTEAIDAAAGLEAAGIRGRVMQGGGYAMVYLDDPTAAAEAATTLDAMDGVDAWTTARIPEALRFRHPTRVGHVVATTRPPVMLTRSGSSLNRWRQASSLWGGVVGTHGYDPTLPDMGASLFALGRGVPAGTKLPRVNVIDVAPTVAALLGIGPPAQSEGRAIPGLGAAPAAP